MLRTWKDDGGEVVDTSQSRSSSYSMQQSRSSQISNGIRTSSSSSSTSAGNMTLYNTVIEEKIIIEQVDTSGIKLAEQLRKSLEEKYQNCSSSVQELLQWLQSIEKELSTLQPIKETLEELKHQISSIKFIHDDLWSRSDDVNSTVVQIRQVATEETKNFSQQELTTLDEYGNQLKKKYDRAESYADQLLRKSTTAYEELTKYNMEKNVFNDWLEKSCQTLVEMEKKIAKMNMKEPERMRTFVSDVVSHKAELRFLEMTANRFIDTSQEFLSGLNDMRSKLSQRLPALRKKDSKVQEEVKEISKVYNDLLARANKLFDNLELSNRQKDFQSSVDDAIAWLKSMTPRVQKLVDEPLGINPRETEDQLRRAKLILEEMNSNRTVISTVKQSANALARELPATEGNAVQKTAKEIEDRHDKLLVTVNTKIQEIESGSTLINKIDENLKTLNKVLDREEKRLPKTTIGTSNKEAESIVNVLNSILQTLTDNVSLLDTTRSFINELLRKGQGSESLRTTFVSVQNRWAELDKSAKEKLTFSDTIKKFYDLQHSLNAWLDGKERTINALETSSQAATKVENQLHQIKTLREDFKSQNPKLVEFNGTGETLLRKANPSPTEHRAIEDILTSINQRWKTLISKLDERKSHIDSLMESNKDFDRNVKRIEEVLRKISDDLDSLSHDKARMRPDALQLQITSLDKGLVNVRPGIDSLELAGQKLIDTLTDPSVKADVKQKLTGIGRLYDNCIKKLDTLKNAVEANEKQLRDFNDACNDTQKWIDALLSQLEKISVSGDRQILREQVSKYERIYQEVISKRTEIQRLIQKGKDFDSVGNVSNLVLLQQTWTTVEKEATSTRTRLQKASEACTKYDKVYQPFIGWLTQAERKLSTLRLTSVKKLDVERNLRELQDFKRDLLKHSHEHSEIESSGHTFLDLCDRDKDGIRGELRDLKERWEAINHEISTRLAEIEQLLEKVRTFGDAAIAAKKTLDRCDTDLQNATIPTKIRRIGDELNGLEKTIDGIRKDGEVICRCGDDHRCDTQPIRRTAEELWDRLSNLKSKLNTKTGNFEAEQKALGLCKEKLNNIASSFNAFESELERMKPIGRDIPTVEGQIDEIQDFRSRLEDEDHEFEHLASHVDQLSQRGTDTSKLKPQVDELRKKLSQLKIKSTTRSSDLDNVLKKLQEFYRLYNLTDDDIERLLRQEVSLENAQALEEFRKREIPSVGKRVDEVNAIGRGLLKTAPSGVNTSVLENELEKLNEKWKLLQDKIAEKKRGLEGRQLRGRQFDDTIASFLASLKQLEGLLIDDSRVHGDLETVKGLVNQHKKVEDQLQTKRKQLQDILRTGAELIELSISSDEKSRISHQLLDIKEVFEKIRTKCDSRTSKLEFSLKDAEKLNRIVHTLLEWFTMAEKKRRSFPESSTDLDEGAAIRMLEEQEKFLREISAKEGEKDSTLDFTRMILSKAHPNAVPTLKNWISSIETKWTDLSTWATKRRQKLQDLLSSLRDNTDSLKELMAWLKRREEALSRLDAKVLPNNVDELIELIKDHNQFMEVQEDREGDINGACNIRAGLTGKRITQSPIRGISPSRSVKKNLASENLFPSLGPKFDKLGDVQSKNLMVKQVWDKWRQVWTHSWERQRRLQRKYDELLRKFDWEEWRKRFLKHMNYNKERIRGLFTKLDRKNTGLVIRSKFIEAIVNTEFQTTDAEMNQVANMFDNRNDQTDYPRFIAALRPDWEEKRVVPDSQMINNEIQKQVSRCTCKLRFRVEQVAEGQYRFGESQKLRLVRILRSTVMVRVGGGWEALEEFLLKNDPCRMKGRTNVELRDQLRTAENMAEVMAAFKSKRRDTSKSHSPSPLRQISEQDAWKSSTKY